MYKKVAKAGIAGLVLVGTINHPWNLESNQMKTSYVQAAENKASVIKLVNGDFEDSAVGLLNQSQVPGWSTTATDQTIEIMRNFGGIPAASGHQWAELNAYQVAALYQDVATEPGKKVRWQVYHRGRAGIDTAVVEFGAPGGPLVEQTKMSTNKTEWKLYKGSYTIPAGQTTTRFQFRSVSAAGGDQAIGNFLDDVVFSTPSELALTGQFTPDVIRKKQTSTYQLVLKNDGGLPASNNQVTIQLPKEVSYVAGTLKADGNTISGEQYDAVTHKVTFTLADIADGAQTTVTLDVKGEEVASKVQATASVSYQDKNFDDETYHADSNNGAITVEADEKPVIEGPEVSLKIGDTFDPMKNMKATDKEDGNLTSKLQVIDNPVDTSKVGVYTVKYQVTDSGGNVTNFDRKVTVRTNEKPVITGESETTVKAGRDFDTMSTMKASDKEDGDLTAKLEVVGAVDTNKIGDYTLTYTIKDSDENQTSFTRVVHVVSNEKPVITGETETSLKAGHSFDPMSTMKAADKEDGDLTKQMSVSGKVDTTLVGDYTLTYKVVDSDENVATFTRVVHVLSNEAPLILGEREVRLNPDSSFDPLDKVTAMDKEDGDLTAKLKVLDNQVNTKVPGIYEVHYTVTDSDENTVTFTKKVIVTEAPVITGAKEIQVNPNSSFEALNGIKASDKEDGDITKAIKVLKNDVNTKVPGTYHVTYQVTDSDGNQATFERIVVVTHAPAIEADDQTIQQGGSFDPLKDVKASDKEDGDLTKQVTVKKSNVNPQVPGVYQVTYMVKDKDGNWAEKTIQVTVQAVPKKGKSAPVQPQKTVIPKTGDQSEWPWSMAGGILLMTSLGLLALRKKH
ncbi:immunoglobulin-like domain-containing protein [Listeria ilorinensis]|uniref:immunoglobulin-like domain-containing protein n=1 Tax=Listeria ilorinensis TaxID=2867439 RepID=UPI001EF4EC3A|nr:immunoglobulin-like domain-containing protein [Listeria ilorinensis]